MNGRTGIAGGAGRRGDNNHHRRISLVITMLGENVLVVDACPDNLLRLSFNVDFTHRQGWARAMLDG